MPIEQHGPAFAARIVRGRGRDPVAVTPLGGVVNEVFRVRGAGFDWVVRFPADPERRNEFPVEEWAMRAARQAGIPVPDVVGSGRLDDRPYLVLQYCEPAVDGLADPWTWLGRYARSVGRLPLAGAPEAVFSRFGRDLPAAWQAHVAYNLDSLGADDPLRRDGAYAVEHRPALRALLAELQAEPFDFGLAHGDLAPRNLIAPARPAAPVLLDWGAAGTGPAPWTDLQRVYQSAVHDRTITPAALADFAAAAGTPMTEATERVLLALTVLRFLDLARWARERRPELYSDYLVACTAGIRTALRP
ncbi:aminoglycoside phosphotransferase family protein [Cryobacterium sp.]|jgi:Ser/Thr protein kinase RdoA (MazF antagonist)|uniref:aminoglycoside phosphotransferase family protein n=1 Tax=Cryobacterium sp. TaxID=1926290 RepID=UPI002611F946|nr:aminoglycoside phosphotransferase family protein [Cryobacterium sp.]MCU1447695.1 putative aminoglycoside phosphotransferase [Cryobacterium sp.]